MYQWNDGRRGQDGWDRYTRRRKWYRDAELVDVEDGSNATEETISTLTQALEKEKAKKEKESEGDNISLSSTTPLTRRRRWFGGSKDKERLSRTSSSADVGRATSSKFFSNTDGAAIGSGKGTPSRPISIQNSRKPSQHSFREGSVVTSESASIREKDLANAQDHHDRWATRAADGTERAEREFGLSDEVNMALS